MKILILSDSHGSVETLNNIVNNVEFDHLFFLGDGIKDLGNLVYADNVHVVRGNCDLFCKDAVEQVVKLEGVVYLLAHGHTYGVKRGIGALRNRAKEVGANVVLFGHTHQFLLQEEQDLTICNPGSLSLVRGGSGTYVELEQTGQKTLFKRIKI